MLSKERKTNDVKREVNVVYSIEQKHFKCKGDAVQKIHRWTHFSILLYHGGSASPSQPPLVL